MSERTSSRTARLIAAATIMREYRRGSGSGEVAPPGAAAWCRRFLASSREDRALRWSVGTPLGRVVWGLIERVMLPGVVTHWMRRKQEIDRLAREASAEGFTRLIVLGAGLDTLAFRLAEEGIFTRVVSADHPATLGVVRSAIENYQLRDLELVPLDLGRHAEVESFVAACNAGTPGPTLIVIEGVLMYLHEQAVACLLGSLATLGCPRVRLIASVMAARPGSPVGFRGQSSLVGAWLARGRETMLWACELGTMQDFFRGLGWDDARLVGSFGEGGQEQGAGGSLASERLIVAERGASG